MEVRVVRVEARTVVNVLLIVLGFVLLLEVIWISRQVITWILVALFLALALNPAVEFFQRVGISRRGYAAALTSFLTLLVMVGLGSLFVPTLVGEANDFVGAVPDYVQDVSEGRGPLGDLADRYDLVERVRTAVKSGGASGVLGLSGTALTVTKSILTTIVAAVTIAFMTFFMLLEGPSWLERFFALLPEGSQERARRVGVQIYKTIGGYVTGNLLISVIAGIASTVVLLVTGVSFAVALGLLVAILDLVPLAGATLAAIIVTTVAFIDQGWIVGLIVLVFFVVYQQVENHVLQPLVYSRTVQLSPLAILISVLIGAKLGGVLGALGAIPVAGAIQVILAEWLRARRERLAITTAPP
ncbi:MAG TPA: AI-2E family transporter [Gaiellaceae bacterium]|nr:AI-2E family transporter [Gaiellaceae bacterium]